MKSAWSETEANPERTPEFSIISSRQGWYGIGEVRVQRVISTRAICDHGGSNLLPDV